jgi:hypothetical protein
VTLRHAETGGFLHSLRHATFGHPLPGQLEVCAVKASGKESRWFAAEGVYLPQVAAANSSSGGGSSGSSSKVEL